MKKKTLFLVFVFILTALCTHVAFAIPNPSSEFAYVVVDDHVEIIGYEGTRTTVEVPSSIGGKPVTSVRLGNTQYESTNRFLDVRKVILPSTVTELGESAFGYYTNLESVEGLEYIERITGNSIFTFCGLPEAHFSTRLKEVASDAFNDSGSLRKVTLPDDAFYDTRSLGLRGVSELTLLRGDGDPTIKLVNNAIYSADGKKLMSVLPCMQDLYYVVEDGTEIIDLGAFSNVIFMEELELPRSITTIHNDGGGLYLVGHDVTVHVYPHSYAHTFFLDYMEQYPSDAKNLTLNVIGTEDELTIKQRTDEIINEVITEGMSDLAKARALHDWICDFASYDYTLTKFKASDILFGGSGVCDAYTRAYAVLLDAVGIENRRITCQLNGVGHAVNGVCIDGTWFYVDITNDDGGFGYPADLFGFNDDVYHAFYTDDTGVIANSLKYYAPYTSGSLDAAIEEMSKQIEEKLLSGVTSFTVTLSKTSVGEIQTVALCSILEDRSWSYEGAEYELSCSKTDGVDFSCYLIGEKNQPEFSYYTNVRGNLTISSYNGTASSVTVPAMLDGMMVDALASAFRSNQVIQQVELPESIVEINDLAFCGCTALEKINFPSTLKKIGNNAFDGCTRLETNPVFADGLEEIGRDAFYQCHSITAASIPGTVSQLGREVFGECSNLSSVMLGDGITTLPKMMFWKCLSLKKLELPRSLTTIEEGVISQSNVTALHIPANVSSIHWGAFAHAERLSTLTAAQDNAYYAVQDNMLFTKDMKTLVATTLSIDPAPAIPSTVTKIGDYAFIHNQTLTSIHIPASVRVIGNYAFSNTRLESVYMEDGVEVLGRYAFASAEMYVGGIGYFGGGPDLTSLRLSGHLKEIEEGAFIGHHPDLTIILPDSLTTIDAHFIDYNRHIYVPESITYIAPQPLTEDWYEMVIHGVPGSYAQTFAEENGYTFQSTMDQITLSETSITLLEKETHVLTVDVINGTEAGERADEVIWTSSDPCVTVEGGVLTAEKMGNAVITATWNGISASCEVKVGRLDEITHMSHIGFADTILRANESRDMQILGVVSFLPTTDGETEPYSDSMDLINHCAWSISDPAVMRMTVTPYTVILVGIGPGSCTVTATFPLGETSSLTYTVAAAQQVDPETCEHVFVTDAAVNATCNKTGLTEGSHCEVCGLIQVAQESIPATGQGHQIVLEASAAEAVLGQPLPTFTLRLACGCEALIPDDEVWSVTAPASLKNEDGINATLVTEKCGVYTATVSYHDSPDATCTVIVHSASPATLPAALEVIEEEAFQNAAVDEVVLSEGIHTISSRAFADCDELALIYLPQSLSSIASDAFDGCASFTIVCHANSEAQHFSAEMGIPYLIQ